ncbi:MAG TPA: outer membrane protein assembly factor BamB [Nevskia sp.]|jgi:outer membrane protein assembly factor BamB|nr:outer membrane protein assembly factor BamB [Nevskia sp.]
MAGAGGFRTGLRFALAVALAAAAMAGCSSKGKTREPAKLVSIAKEELRIDDVWSRHIGDGSDGYVSGFRVAVAEDAVFAASIDGKVYALNPKSGDLIWRAKTRARVISGPSVNGNQVLVGTLDGEVIALKRADGSELWRTRAPSEALAAPVGSGNTVVAKAVDGREYGLDAATGERRWAFDRNEPNLTLRGLSMPLIIGNRVYNGLDNGKLSVLNLLDGTQVWEQTISVPTGRSELDRVIDIDADMLPGNDGLFVVTYGGDLTLVDYNTGDSRWRRSVKSYAGMALGGDKLFVTDDDGTVWALDAATGAAAWKQQELKYRRLSPPAFYKGYVVVGDYKGYLHWLSPGDGRIVARTRLGSDPIAAPLAAGGDLLYVMDVGGKLRAYDTRPR